MEDKGAIPNSEYPVVIHRNSFTLRGDAGAEWLEERFAANNWTNSWRNGIYDYHHYHDNTHEVLGIYEGSALLELGGENGEKVRIFAGDIIIIPAGVGHRNLEEENLAVVGAYPEGRTPALKTGKENERPEVDRNIAAVPLPQNDPLKGTSGGLKNCWKWR